MADSIRNENAIKKEIAEVNKKLEAIESALFKAREITKAIKYENPAMGIISSVKGLMNKNLAVDPNELEMAESAVIEASNNLESAIYGLDEVFAESHKNLKYQLDDLESELSDIEYDKKYGRQSMKEMKDYAIKPGDKVYVKGNIGSDRVIRIVGDQVYLQKAGRANMTDISRVNPGLGSQVGDAAKDIGKGLKTFFKSKEPFEKESQGPHGDIHGSNQPDTTSVISGRNKNENPGCKTMDENKEQNMKDDLSVENLRQLAGVKQTVSECGPMGGMGHTPASINITASSGPELTGMLKDIMSLAGVHKVEPEHMPLASTPGPSTVISAPPMAGVDQGPSMKDMIAIVDEPTMSEPDSMNQKSPLPGRADDNHPEEEGLIGGALGGLAGAAMGGLPGAALGYAAGSKAGDDLSGDEEQQEAYNNSPDEEMQSDPVRRLGDVNNNMHNALIAEPVDHKNESIEQQLIRDYQKFISESVVTEKWTKKSSTEKSPASGKSASQIQSEIDSIKSKGPAKKGSPDQKKLQSLQLAKRNKAKTKKTTAEGWPGDAVADEDVTESKKKPSAGLTKKEKSSVVKKAKKGGDIGKSGKMFKTVAAKAAKKYGSKERGDAAAAAAMWKGVAAKKK